MKHQVSEAAGTIHPDHVGRWRARIIEGDRWGSSGFYPATVLERDGATTWPQGTAVFFDHPGEQERYDRPERSVRDLAGRIASTPAYEESGPEGPGLYADIEFYSHAAPIVKEMAADIGLSIRAAATVEEGEAQGRRGPIIQALHEGMSVDLVTKAGAGGKLVSLIESARPNLMTEREQDTNAMLRSMNETFRRMRTARRMPVPATDPTNLPTIPVVEATPNSDTTSVPAPVGQSITAESRKDKHMATIQIEESELGRLREDAGRVQALETERDTATRERDEARAQLAESQRRTAAKTIVEAQAREHDIAFSPLEERGLLTDLPLTSDGEFDETAFTDTVTTEAARKAEQNGAGAVRGFGASTNLTEANSGDGISEADYLAQFDVKGA